MPVLSDEHETLDRCEQIAKRLCAEDGSTPRWPTVARLFAAALVDPEFRALVAVLSASQCETVSIEDVAVAPEFPLRR